MATVINNLRQAPFLVGADLDIRLESEHIISKGVPYALFYFWFDLRCGFYKGLLPIEKVKLDVEYFTKKYPAFSDEIAKWFQGYQSLCTV
ncbi:MAG: hypothetical protein QM762_12440 [Chryseolinea sp.]